MISCDSSLTALQFRANHTCHLIELCMDQMCRLLQEVSQELRDVDLQGHVDRLHINQLSPMRFATEFVARNKPVIIEGAVEEWPALRRWDEQYLSSKAGDRVVTVDLTPNGRGDAVTQVTAPRLQQQAAPSQSLPNPDQSAHITQACQQGSWFITPCEVEMTVSSFFQLLRHSRDTRGSHSIVPYVQHQNSSLSEEWEFLHQDIQPHMEWADQVFGAAPDATNIWIGDERSVTSFHKDHYENLYAVIHGTKVFHLLPPCDMWRMNLRNYPAAAYQLSTARSTPSTDTDTTLGAFSVAVQGDQGSHQTELMLGTSCLSAELKQPLSWVLWSDVELQTGTAEQQGCAPRTMLGPDLPAPLVAEVGPGEVLYLPAMWYHQVSQQCSQAAEGHDYVMAVNFWYDMAFDHRWSYFKLVEGCAVRLGLADAPRLLGAEEADEAEEEEPL